MQNYDTTEVKKIMQQVILSGNNLLDIVNNVLDISKIESGKATIIENEYKCHTALQNGVPCVSLIFIFEFT